MLKFKVLKEAIEKSWGQDTCYPSLAREWSEENPALGQCAITALTIEHYFGGKIPYCSHTHHYWNILPSGKKKDLTRGQFKRGTKICQDGVRSRKYLLESEGAIDADTAKRLEIFLFRVEVKLA